MEPLHAPPPLWVYPVAGVLLLLWLFVMCIMAMAALVALAFFVSLFLRLCGHTLYTLAAWTLGIEHPLCGYILEFELEEVTDRMKRRELALIRREPCPRVDATMRKMQAAAFGLTAVAVTQ